MSRERLSIYRLIVAGVRAVHLHPEEAGGGVADPPRGHTHCQVPDTGGAAAAAQVHCTIYDCELLTPLEAIHTVKFHTLEEQQQQLRYILLCTR